MSGQSRSCGEGKANGRENLWVLWGGKVCLDRNKKKTNSFLKWEEETQEPALKWAYVAGEGDEKGPT